MTLTEKRCAPCEGGMPPLTAEEVSIFKVQIPKWNIAEDAKSISRTFKFKNFVEAMDFANRITTIAEAERHHPDLRISWGRVSVDLTTHAIQGLSENDFIMAAKIDAL